MVIQDDHDIAGNTVMNTANGIQHVKHINNPNFTELKNPEYTS